MVKLELTVMKLEKKKSYKLIGVFFKLLIILFSLVFIYQKIFLIQNPAFSGQWKALFFQQPQYLLLVFLLMLLNWSLEALKWKVLIHRIENISFFRSFMSVFSGVTVSLFTPNRIGDFGGRIFFIPKNTRALCIVPSLLGSASQLLITLILGVFAFVFYFSGENTSPFSIPNNYFILVISLVSLIGLFILFYLKTPFFLNFLGENKYLKKIKKHFEVISNYSTGELVIVLLLSFIRYLVFSWQFYLLLKMFSVDLPLLGGAMMIALTFFAATLLPTFALTEIGIRGSVAIALIGVLSANSVGIITASLALWLVNLGFPAICGCLFIFTNHKKNPSSTEAKEMRLGTLDI